VANETYKKQFGELTESDIVKMRKQNVGISKPGLLWSAISWLIKRIWHY